MLINPDAIESTIATITAAQRAYEVLHPIPETYDSGDWLADLSDTTTIHAYIAANPAWELMVQAKSILELELESIAYN